MCTCACAYVICLYIVHVCLYRILCNLRKAILNAVLIYYRNKGLLVSRFAWIYFLCNIKLAC